MKVANALLALLFLVFAYFQWNDPDPWVWLTLYAAIAIAFGLAVSGRILRPLILAAGLTCLVLMGLSLPGVIDYATNQEGYTLMEGMSYEKPYIEETREFGGALMGLLALGFLWWQQGKKQ